VGQAKHDARCHVTGARCPTCTVTVGEDRLHPVLCSHYTVSSACMVYVANLCIAWLLLACVSREEGHLLEPGRLVRGD
jgi:hypothetical protein